MLPGLHLLAVVGDDVRLVGVDGVGGPGPALHDVFRGRDVPGLDGIVPGPGVEVVHGGVATLADQVIHAHAAVQPILCGTVQELVATGTAQIGPTPLPVQLGGTVQVQNARPRIVLSDARISGVQMPQAARQSVESTLQSQLDTLMASQPMRVSSVTIGSGTLTVIGQRA